MSLLQREIGISSNKSISFRLSWQNNPWLVAAVSLLSHLPSKCLCTFPSLIPFLCTSNMPKMLFKFKKAVSPLCDFCEKELETIEHLFFHCTKVSTFWHELKVVLNSLDKAIRFDIKSVLFRILDTDNISILVNYILLESKYFIYRCKLNEGSLCVRLLVDKFTKTFQTKHFNTKKNKIHFHNKK